MIDWQQIRQLQEDVGEEEMPELIALFLCEVDEAMDELDKNQSTLSTDESAAAFHFLKGCASNLGFQAFGDMCSEGEQVTKNGCVPNFKIPELMSTYQESKKEFLQNYDQKLSSAAIG